MPVKSKAQMRAMQAAAHGDSTLGIPQGVAEDFITASHGMDMSKMPEHAKGNAKGKKIKAVGHNMGKSGYMVSSGKADEQEKKHDPDMMSEKMEGC